MTASAPLFVMATSPTITCSSQINKAFHLIDKKAEMSLAPQKNWFQEAGSLALHVEISAMQWRPASRQAVCGAPCWNGDGGHAVWCCSRLRYSLGPLALA